MTKENSKYGIISFISLIMWLILFILKIVDQSISKYDFYDRVSILSTLSSYLDTVIITIFAICFLTGLVGLILHDPKKTILTISMSICSVFVFLSLLMLIQESTYVYRVEKGTLTNYGIFNIPTKKIDSLRTKKLYEQRYLTFNTDVIPASKGLSFGFNFVISGEPNGESVKIMEITKYPSIGLRKNNKTVLADTAYYFVKLNTIRYSGFKFDYDYELIPGKWEFEMWYNGKKLLSKIFNVITP